MNQFVSTKQIARETLTRLCDNLVFPNLIYRDDGGNRSVKKGDTVQVRRPVRLEAKEFSGDTGIEPQNLVEEAVDVKLDTIASVDIELSAIEAACDMDSLTRLFLEPAAAALAEKINADGLGLYRDIRQSCGTPGTLPDSLSAFADASLLLDEAKVPTDRRCAVWSPYATSRLKQIPAVVSAQACGSTKALRTGNIGCVFGLENYMSQAVVNHIAGSLAGTSYTLTVTAKSAGSVEITASASSGTVSISGKTLVCGDLLLADDYTLLVSADCTASGATKITVPVDAASYAAAKIGDTVTVAANHDANLVFHPHAFAFVTRPLATPAGVESYVTSYNGISLRVVRAYDVRYKKEILSMDVLYAFKTVYPELAVRYLG
mgnify:FL=1